MQTTPFRPGASQSINANTAAQPVSINGDSTVAVRIAVKGADVFLKFGRAADNPVASSSDMILLANTVESFSKGRADTLSIVCPAGSATVYITEGEGF